jgi:hypothetical protein
MKVVVQLTKDLLAIENKMLDTDKDADYLDEEIIHLQV